MSVQFILGRSGSGKTSLCTKSIVDDLLQPGKSKPLLLLVPEQATSQVEHAILSEKAIAGYNRLKVVSFERLQVLLSGKTTAKAKLSRAGRQMVVERILRENKEQLKIFAASVGQIGLSRQTADIISELHQYAKEPEDIVQLLTELQKDKKNSTSAFKFADIGLIFEKYLTFIEEKLLDPDVQLNLARREVAKADFIRGAKLWVDGFSGFTTSQLAILTEMLKTASDTKIALCLDPSKINLENPGTESPDPAGLFNLTERTYTDLVETIDKCKLKRQPPVILKVPLRFSRSRQLAHLERNIFELQPQSPPPPGSDIHILSAANGRAEVQFIADQIHTLIKEQGYRYRQIAVIASDINYYQHYIRAYFEDYNIPFFIDKPKSLNQHPLVRLICSALQIITGGFLSSDIFCYLKTSLVPIESFDVDQLDNYSLAFGIGPADWQSDKDWGFADKDNRRFDEKRINQIRRKAISPLLDLKKKLRPDNEQQKLFTAREFTQIIFDFLRDLKVFETMSAWIKDADSITADEHRQFYQALIDIFDELTEVFGDQKMTGPDYFAIINSAFSQMTLAFIPPGLDQVLVGSIERSRHPDLKAVFLTGATQKQFPIPLNQNYLLTDHDRSLAESADFTLAVAPSRMLAERQYLAYIAFTRASKLLYITYPLADEKGSPAARSQFIADIESLSENPLEESIATSQDKLDEISNKTELAELLCSRLGKDSTSTETKDNILLTDLLNCIAKEEKFADLASMVTSAINYDNRAQLDRQVMTNFFSGRIKSSATKLSTFAACPYRYFARYTLSLKEREEFKLRPLDIGTFYHSILNTLQKRLAEDNKNFATTDDSQLIKLLHEQIELFIQTDSFISHFARHSAHNTFIITSAAQTLEDCVIAIAKMARAGSLFPADSEVSFGQADSELGEYKIKLSDTHILTLRGIIDRIDTAQTDDGKKTIIFDYKKKGEKSFSWSKFYYGLDMQLPIYMLALSNTPSRKYKAAEIAGAFYLPVEVKTEKAAFDELPARQEKFYHKANGIFNGRFASQLDRHTTSKDSEFYNFYVTKDGTPYGNYHNRGALKPNDFENVLTFTEKKIVQLVQEILSGKIDIAPYKLGTDSPCGNCEYKSVCRFDWQINDYNYLDSVNKTKVLEEVNKS